MSSRNIVNARKCGAAGSRFFGHSYIASSFHVASSSPSMTLPNQIGEVGSGKRNSGCRLTPDWMLILE